MRERAQESQARSEDDLLSFNSTEELLSREHYGGGGVPEVQEQAGAPPAASASEQAYDVVAEAEDKNAKELKEKVALLVERQYGGDYRRAFDHYAKDDQGVDRDGIIQLLEDAGVGSRLTRGMWADGILKKVDANKDATITWAEFETVFQQRTASA